MYLHSSTYRGMALLGLGAVGPVGQEPITSKPKGSGVAGHSTREMQGANGANSFKGAKASNGANGAKRSVSNVPSKGIFRWLVPVRGGGG